MERDSNACMPTKAGASHPCSLPTLMLAETRAFSAMISPEMKKMSCVVFVVMLERNGTGPSDRPQPQPIDSIPEQQTNSPTDGPCWRCSRPWTRRT